MLNKIIDFSLKNRITILFAAILLIAAGVYTTENAEVDVFPDLNAPTVVIMTEAPGMAAEEVEQIVTFPIETAVNGATGVRRVRSSSATGFSIVWVEFNWETDIYLARQIVSEKLAIVSEKLPDYVSKPTLGPQSSLLGEVYIVSLTSDSTSMLDLRTIADWTFRPRLLSTGGVAQVAVLGGDVKEYQIQMNLEKMKYYGITTSEVLAATNAMNTNASGGVIYEHSNEYIIHGAISSNKTEEISTAVVKRINNHPILISDIAKVKIGIQVPKLGLGSEKTKPAVLLTVTKQPNTSTIKLTEKLENSIEDLKKNIPSDIHVSTNIFKQSNFIESSINNVKRSLLEGGIFVIIVLFLFLANVRTTVISLVTLPISILVSILTIHHLGFTINTMSLGGLAIAIGSLVDDAIVDVENVYKRLKENAQLPKEERESIIEVVFKASKEVRMPILNSTLIIIVSFIPLFFLSGMEGRMLVPLGIAFIVALFASTIVALTLTPVLCSYLLGKKMKENKLPKEAFLSTWLKKIYKKSLIIALNYKKTVLASTIILFIVSLFFFFNLGRNFLPQFNEGSFTINVSTLPGTSLKESDKIGRQAEKLLLSIPEIQTVARKTGRAELAEHALGVNACEIEAPFVLEKRSRSEVIADVRHKLSEIVGVNVEIGQPISHRIDAMLSGTKANIAIKLFGDDLIKMYSLANDIKGKISNIEGIADLNVEQQIERPQMRITPKRQMLAKYGITLPEFKEYINLTLAGRTIGQVYENGKAFNLVLKVKESARESFETINDMIIDADGTKIPLSYIAEIESTTSPNTINRENVKRKIVISANIADRDLRGIVDDIKNTIETKITLPEGYHIEYGGQFESEQRASNTLFLTSIFSIIIIFLLIYQEFKSFKQSGVILLNLPLALIGGVFALTITNGEISIPAIIGFISLFGIATRNGMLLISHYNQLISKGNNLYDSIIKGSLDRLNPILMTALSSALALIPLALNGDLAGNEIQSPMAKVILGGLLTSTFLNGFIIPIVYLLMNKKKNNEQA